MADKPGNAPTQQQVNDAQHLDNMTSLQQPSAAEQSPITQNGEVRGDAPVSAPPTPNPDNPSLFNEPKNPNNKVVEVESQKTTEFLEEGGVFQIPLVIREVNLQKILRGSVVMQLTLRLP